MCGKVFIALSLISPVDVDHSLGPLLMMCGLWTAPCQGEHCSTGAVRRRSAGETKGLSRSGVNGMVKGLCMPPAMERAKTEPGVFNSMAGLGVNGSSPELTMKTECHSISPYNLYTTEYITNITVVI